MFEDNMDRRSSLQERVDMLNNQGYRGFTIAKSSQTAGESVQVTAKNKKGLLLTAVGDSLDEACENMIEKIDYTLDDSR